MLLVYHLNLARQVAPVSDKQGGDDVLREEYWEVRKSEPRRDATLDTVIRQAYDKAMGKVSVSQQSTYSACIVRTLDYESDDEDVLMLMMG